MACCGDSSEEIPSARARSLTAALRSPRSRRQKSQPNSVRPRGSRSTTGSQGCVPPHTLPRELCAASGCSVASVIPRMRWSRIARRVRATIAVRRDKQFQIVEIIGAKPHLCCEQLKRWRSVAAAGGTIRDGKGSQHSPPLRRSTTPKRTPPSRTHRRQRGQRGQSHPERPPCVAMTAGAAGQSRRDKPHRPRPNAGIPSHRRCGHPKSSRYADDREATRADRRRHPRQHPGRRP